MLWMQRQGTGNGTILTFSRTAVWSNLLAKCLQTAHSFSRRHTMSRLIPNVKGAEMAQRDELELFDRENGRLVSLARFENPPRIMVCLETDLGGYVFRSLDMSEIEKLRDWL